MSAVTVELEAGPDGFTDDKDEAKRIREKTIIPALEAGGHIVLDFCKLKSSTQSFVHALLGEALQRFREPALDKIQFKDCTPLMKSLVQLVVDYSLGGFRSEHYEVNDRENETVEVPKPKAKRRAPIRARAGNRK